jgi:hypothetical protein
VPPGGLAKTDQLPYPLTNKMSRVNVSDGLITYNCLNSEMNFVAVWKANFCSLPQTKSEAFLVTLGNIGVVR